MLAAIWNGPNDMVLADKPIPEVVPGSVLLKVKACAICGSDLRIFGDGNPRISPPHTLGHEISGEIVAVGEGVTESPVRRSERLIEAARTRAQIGRHQHELALTVLTAPDSEVTLAENG